MKYQDLHMVGNTHVFLDISIDDIKCGRAVIELFKDHVPKTAENFRALCTGEKGIGGLKFPLHYKNTIFHKAVPECIVQGGDITNFDGTGGESIYGPYFEDESLELLHSEAGLLSMANCGMPNTNNSQFCVTMGELPYLDGSYVVFGRVVKGFNIINDISYQPLGTGDRPIPTCKIWDCGELRAGQSWGYCANDFMDVYPPYPQDWEVDTSLLQVHYILQVVKDIKDAGNQFYKINDNAFSYHKYQKALRYLDWYKSNYGDKVQTEDQVEAMWETRIQCHLNAALVCNKLGHFRKAINHCNMILSVETNVKALFRRAVAREAINDHQDALQDLQLALQLSPNDGAILAEMNRIQRFLNDYQQAERLRYKQNRRLASRHEHVGNSQRSKNVRH